jgi:hypothetical protein
MHANTLQYTPKALIVVSTKWSLSSHQLCSILPAEAVLYSHHIAEARKHMRIKRSLASHYTSSLCTNHYPPTTSCICIRSHKLQHVEQTGSGASSQLKQAGVFTTGSKNPAAVPRKGLRGMFARVRGSSSKTSQVVFDPLSDPVAQEALKLLFAKEGNYVQVHTCLLCVHAFTYVRVLR